MVQEQEHKIVEPNFIVNDEGRVFCTKHTLFNKPPEKPQTPFPPIFSLFTPPQQPPPLTCKNCGHYFNDSCYFAPVSINQIIEERDRGHITCEFCGDRITRSMSVFQMIYYKNKYGVKMPLVCCTCYANLKDNKFQDKAWSRILLLFGLFGMSVLVILYNLTSFLAMGLFTPSIIFLGLGIWFYATYLYARKMLRTWKGQRAYSRLEDQFKDAEPDEE